MYTSKLSTYRQKRIIECFCLDLTATQTCHLLGLNRKTINRYFHIFREAIYLHQVTKLKQFKGEVEVDESYFGPRRIKGVASKRGRGTHRQPVFGIYQRNGYVYTEIIPDCKLRTLRAIMTGKISLHSTIYSDSWKGYTGLVDVGFNKHYRLRHRRNEFSRKHGVHINGIEAFWSFTKRRLIKFNGTKKNFRLHLKECEWRWNKSVKQLQTELKQIIRV